VSVLNNAPPLLCTACSCSAGEHLMQAHDVAPPFFKLEAFSISRLYGKYNLPACLLQVMWQACACAGSCLCMSKPVQGLHTSMEAPVRKLGMKAALSMRAFSLSCKRHNASTTNTSGQC
jgi:hypothetical protein